MNSNSWENKTILIVEDDEVSNEFFNEVLKLTKANLIFTRDGKSAIQICRENPNIDIILMDIQLPVMNGEQAAEEIRNLNKDIIIIAQTAYAMADDRQKYITNGFDDYIAKPIIPKELISLIGKYLH
jgi:CheY-like chemotaxis protein